MDSEGMGGGLSTYDYGFRIYNPHIAKFLSTDPLSKDYPWYTPYQFAGNKPIVAIDLDGLEERIIMNYESLGPVLSIRSQEWDLIEPGPLGSGVLIITYKQLGEVNMILKKNIGAIHSETGPSVKQETSVFSLLQAIDDFLTPDGGFFYTSENGSSKAGEIRAGNEGTLANMDLLISAVTGLHKLCDSNPSFVPGNYTTFNDHTTMSNAMATVLTMLDAIISKVTDLAGALKGEKEKVSTHAKDTVVDIITPTEI